MTTQVGSGVRASPRGIAPLLPWPTVTRCGTCLVTLRDERPTPDAPVRLRLSECAACRVARQRPEDEFGPASQD